MLIKPSNTMYAFVYGTLKRGEPNHGWMVQPGKGLVQFVSEGTMESRYPLVIASKYNIPFLLDVPGKGKVSTPEPTILSPL